MRLRGVSRRLSQVRCRHPCSGATGSDLEGWHEDPLLCRTAEEHRYDGATPTILHAYGGFEVSMTPSYDGTIRGAVAQYVGAYVLANIRGGGEFGPAWHEAGLETSASGSTMTSRRSRRTLSPAYHHATHLGIQGGSNGGLLMGVELPSTRNVGAGGHAGSPLICCASSRSRRALRRWVNTAAFASRKNGPSSPPSRPTTTSGRAGNIGAPDLDDHEG